MKNKKIFPKTNIQCYKTDCNKCGYMKSTYRKVKDKKEWVGRNCVAPDFNKGNNNDNWKNNAIQFPRLIAELETAKVFEDKGTMEALQDSMGLSKKEILELIERASNEYDKIIAKLP